MLERVPKVIAIETAITSSVCSRALVPVPNTLPIECLLSESDVVRNPLRLSEPSKVS